MAEINEKMTKIIQDLGLNKTVREFTNYLRSEPSQKFSTEDEVVDYYKNTIAAINEQLPKIVPKKLITGKIKGYLI